MQTNTKNPYRIRHLGPNDYLDHFGKRCKGYPKITLVTVRENDDVFFGIARCNRSAGDVFNKKIGRHIATERAKLAQQLRNPDGESFILHSSGLRGCCKVDAVTKLLQYVENIEKNLPWNGGSKNA